MVPLKLGGLRALAPDLEAKISDHELMADCVSLDPDQFRHAAACIGCAREPRQARMRFVAKV